MEIAPAPRLCAVGTPPLPALVWDLARPRRVLASTVLGGGLGTRDWIINAQVDASYARTDPAQHLTELARDAGCAGAGVGFLTAAEVEGWTRGHDDGVEAHVTVGLSLPTWAASTDTAGTGLTVGTINVVAFLPVALTDGALVNAVVTATEAKTQALVEAGIAGTGTASDALCIVAPAEGRREQFGGPRSPVGSALARAVHRAVADGAS